jgi:membrane fusion protein, multidrug efflux system
MRIPMKKIIVIAIAILLIAVLILRLSANFKKVNATKNVSTDLQYVSVKVTPVKMLSLDGDLRLVGRMEAFFEVDVATETSGTITGLDAILGQVKPMGSVIAVIDNTLRNLAVQKARSSKERLEKDLGRYKNLFAGGSITEQQLDDAQKAYDDAVILLKQAEKEFLDATVRAPFSGTIINKYVEQGEYINTGNPIVKMIDISRLKIKLSVSESNVYKLKSGENATVSTDVYPDVTIPGKITFISAKGDDAHNYPVEIEIPNNSEHPLRAGTFATVSIKIPAQGKAYYIPRSSLIGSIANAEVYVAENNKAFRKKIVVADGNGDYLRVISGLNADDQVIVSGQINLSDNREIKISK